MSRIFHITTLNASLAARQSGIYRTDSLEKDGFIHFSQRQQILGVANAFYTAQTDLVILVVDVSRLQAELKYEPPVHPSASTSAPAADQLFPHLYGPLNFDAVEAVIAFPLGPDGKFSLPAALPE